MSTTDDEVTFDAPVPKKKAAKKKAKPAAAAPKSSAPFPGMTRTACADSCNAKACAISGIPICAHPTKGGLPAALMNDPAALKRIERARAQLDVRLDPDRFK
jgi:hypothetical protein